MNSLVPSPGSDASHGLQRFDQKIARDFIYKTISEETRAAYSRTIRDFFIFVRGVHPCHVTTAHGIAYRDQLRSLGRKAATVATKLAILSAFFEYLRVAGVITLNPLSPKLVKPPQRPRAPSGRSLTPKEVRYLLSGPDRAKPSGARDYALMLLMLRLALRITEASTLRTSAIRWSHGRWILRCKVKGGGEETWPLPKDVKAAIDHYLKLDLERRQTLHTDADDSFLFQPVVNHRTLVYDKPLGQRWIQKTIHRWAAYTGIGHVTPHDLRRSVVTKLLDDGNSYREAQMVTKHKSVNTLMKYDYGRENLDKNPVNSLSWDDTPMLN